MKLKELLLSTNFDSLIPALQKEGDLAIRQYREAYDILCHLTPADESKLKNKQIGVYWSKPDGLFKDEEPYINVSNCEGDYWENNVAKEVVVDEDCGLKKEDLVAKILWSCTFYGYTPQTTKETFEDRFEHKMHTLYGNRARKLEQKLYFNYLSGKARREILHTKKLFLSNSISMSSEEWGYCHMRMAKASRIKKMRDHRLQKRIDEFDHKEKYEGLREKFLGGKDISFHDMDFIYDDYSMFLTQMETHTFGEMSRVEYLHRLMKYFEIEPDKDMENLQKLVVLCRVSSEHPLSMEEKEAIRAEFSKIAGKGKLMFGTAEDESLGKELHFTILSQSYNKRNLKEGDDD